MPAATRKTEEIIINISSACINGYLVLIDRLAGDQQLQIGIGRNETVEGILIGIESDKSSLVIQKLDATAEQMSVCLTDVVTLDLPQDKLPRIRFKACAPDASFF
ncbi:hypothetical protein DRH29_00255 [candidate division Kazan bacterium]|uniref:Uncharacterized protein n=1 Tax=candidate division Kazan bacterium TaxID=2202143 RepID=A0A420ZDU8_UNCK3|nr:MAG: hypothetical protein DRH29_00255 [candidate division Kazan bacterium]